MNNPAIDNKEHSIKSNLWIYIGLVGKEHLYLDLYIWASG